MLSNESRSGIGAATASQTVQGAISAPVDVIEKFRKLRSEIPLITSSTRVLCVEIGGYRHQCVDTDAFVDQKRSGRIPFFFKNNGQGRPEGDDYFRGRFGGFAFQNLRL